MSSDATSMAGKTVLITGAAGGIGLETARALARMGALVVAAARDTPRGRAVVDELARTGYKAEFLPIDVASQASVRQAATRFTATHPTLDVLVNNAGVALRDRQLGPDGIEVTWATNFLGGFLLTRLLLPVLKRAPQPRVINVSSVAHRNARIHWDDPGLERGFRGFKAYAQSKLAQILFTRELARREPAIAVNAVHPGGIATGIWRAAPRWAQWLLRFVLASPAQGAAPVVRLAAAPELAGVTGRYFDRWKEMTPAPAATNDADATRLWDLAERSTASRVG